MPNRGADTALITATAVGAKSSSIVDWILLPIGRLLGVLVLPLLVAGSLGLTSGYL